MMTFDNSNFDNILIRIIDKISVLIKFDFCFSFSCYNTAGKNVDYFHFRRFQM